MHSPALLRIFRGGHVGVSSKAWVLHAASAVPINSARSALLIRHLTYNEFCGYDQSYQCMRKPGPLHRVVRQPPFTPCASQELL